MVDVVGSMQYAIGAQCVADLGDAPLSIWRSSRPHFRFGLSSEGSAALHRSAIQIRGFTAKCDVRRATCNVGGTGRRESALR